MSPLEIEILLRYHATIEDYPGVENLDHAPRAVGDAIRKFIDAGLLERAPKAYKLIPTYGARTRSPDGMIRIYQPTELCHKYCEAICSVPIPI